MAIIKSALTGGNARKNLHAPFTANTSTTILIEHVFTTAVTAADILELAYLPAGCRIMSLDMQTVGTGAVTADVGFMSGDVGSPDAARTMDAALLDDVTPTTAVSAPMLGLFAAGALASDVPRSIGVRFSGTVAANPATRLLLRATYANT